MTPAGIHLRAQGFLRDGSLDWLLDLRVEDLPAFRHAVADIRAEQGRDFERAVDRLAMRFLHADAAETFHRDQAEPGTPLSEVLP